MVSPDFSEFQFAYGVTRELENSIGSGVIAPPTFPTQNKEKEIGADVVMKIRTGRVRLAPLFIQYKRSSRMIREYATEWSDFGQDYFRFDLHTANQHNTLIEMGEKVGAACYVAPGFYKREEYVSNHRNGVLSENSVCIDVSRLPRISDDDHRIAYTVSPLRGIFYSEPERFDPLRNIYSLISRIEDNPNLFSDYDTLRGDFRELRTQLIERFNLQIEGSYESGNPADWVRNQQQFFFEVTGAQLAFVQRGE